LTIRAAPLSSNRRWVADYVRNAVTRTLSGRRAVLDRVVLAGMMPEQHQEVHVHELGITQGIIDRAREAALAASARRVSDLYIVTTPAADFTQESIEMYFEMLTADDELFAGATLHFTAEAAEAACLACGQEFTTEIREPVCPSCGSQQVRFDPHAVMIRLTDIGIDDGEPGEPTEA
jgi:Zn finger protein HypA/HybF involved in hydrogenase expression